VAELENDIEQFSRLVDALRPWLGKVVFVGGWAHRLYRERPESASLGYGPLRTDDADVAFDPVGLARPDDIRSRLVERGFTEEMSGDDQPPVTHYHLGKQDLGFYAEFLTPLRGSERRRDGSRDVTERVGGLVAQKLRHLDVLLIAPWAVTVGEANGFALTEAAVVYVPNPASFIVQKLLIHSRRRREDQAKDVLYIHDTLELFGGALDTLNHIWHAFVSPALHARSRQRVRTQVTELFGTVSDTLREASLMATDRGLPPTSIQELCELGLARLFK
jgi:hypothetical protein